MLHFFVQGSFTHHALLHIYIELQFLTAVSGRKGCEVHSCTRFVLLQLLFVFHSFFLFSFLLFYGILLFLFTAGHSYPILLSCRFFPVYVAMFQYNRICDAATRYRSVAVNSHPSAMLAEIRILVFTFCLLHSDFLYLAFIPSEVFFRQVAFVGVEAVIPHDAEIAQGNVLQQPGKELTVMQRQFLFHRVSPVG